MLEQTSDVGKQAGEKTAEGFNKAQAAVNATQAAAGGVTSTLAQTAGAAQAAATAVGQVASSVSVLNAEQTRAMALMNSWVAQGNDITKIGVANARYILENVGGMIGSTAQVLQQIISNFESRASQPMQVAQTMADMTRQMEDSIVALEGNQEEIERRRLQSQMDRIAQLEKEARAAGEFDALRFANLRQLAEREHRIRMQQLDEQKRAERTETSGSQGSASRSGSAGLDGGTKTLDININGKNPAGVDFNDPRIRSQITGMLLEELQKHQRTAAVGGGRFY